MIELKNINKVYKTQAGSLTALSDINITINDGEIFGIIGLSGAGKSTLVRCINLLERPTSGEVFIDGRNIVDMPKKDLLEMRRSIGMIFQGFNLLEQRSVLKNICFPLEISGVSKSEAESRARQLLEVVALSDKAEAYPSQLSGGQKQRVAIARALATNPKYLLCDEATSALDPNTTRSILALLKDINKKMDVTIVVITHEMSVIDKICDRVAVIDNGCIAEQGKVSEVFVNPKSDIAKELILPKSISEVKNSGIRTIRIIFDGENSNKPVLSQLVLSAQVPVNIIFADTKDIDGKAYGHMILQIPSDKNKADKIITWLNVNNITYREEE